MRLGADPETFLINPSGKHISSLGLINADKWNPMQIPNMAQGFTLQEDNVSLEYGIPPAASAEEFIKHINSVMEASRPYIKDLSFSKLSCVVFDKDQMLDPRAHMFGCEADYDAWGDNSLDEQGDPKNVNKKPVPPHEYMRSAGGHIHVETKEDPIEVVQAMDLFLGVPSVLMDVSGSKRREMYGKRGAHRIKSYGVEYRTLSNFWIFDEKLIRWAWNQTQKALSNLGGAKFYDKEIEQAINGNSKKAAKWLVKECNLELA